MILPGPFVPDHYPPTPLINGTLVPLRTASQPLPNLSIPKVSLKPSQPKVGEVVRVNFTVENIGDAAADGVTVSLYLNDTSHKYELIESSQPLNLKSGESQSHSFSSTIKAAMGFQAVIVVADDISSVKEVQKDNNALIRLFQVSPGDLAAIPEKTTTVSSTVTVATTLTVTQTASVTSTSFQTRMSTVTETTTTVSAHPNQYVYGSALLVVATILLATFAVTKAGRAAKNTNG
jgi:subtilase family serine protease